MKLQLHSIEQMPRQTPPWHLMMDDLCHPPAKRVAKVLGIGLRSVQRYNRTGNAPRTVCLAIFWLTSWGRNAVHTQAHNDALMLGSYVRGLTDEIGDLKQTINHMLKIGDFGAANQPAIEEGHRPGRPYVQIR